ncbi:MAG: hypothetical protein JSS32_10790, partial [Verrucomicrobia bacterium]|nr:hypothetical protein [Verrucomicrobiota bacterium]
MSHSTPQNPASSSGTSGVPLKMNASTNDTTVTANSSNTLFFIASTGITVSGDGPTNSIIFSGGQDSVSGGGTGRSSLTSHGVLLGEGINAVNVTAPGTNGQLLIGSTGADPLFSTVSSSAGTLSFTTGAGSLNIEVTISRPPGPLAIASGGTNATTFGVGTSSALYFDGNKLTSIPAGTSGQVLASQGTGTIPQFQTFSPFDGISITANTAQSVSSSSFFILGNTTPGFPFSTQFTGNKLFINASPIPTTYGGSGVNGLTRHGVVLGEGGSNLSAAAMGTNGQVLMGSTGADPVFSLITSSQGTILFTLGGGLLNMEVSANPNLVADVTGGGTGRSILTSHGVLLGEGSNQVNVTAAGTNGQLFIGSTNLDPAFATVSSVTGTISFTTGANSLSVDLNAPIPIAFGGTNATTFGSGVSSVLFFNGNKIAAATPGTAGQFLLSAGIGNAPSFQTVSGSPGISITDNANNSVSSSGFFILGSTAAGFPISTQFATSTLFINLNILTADFGGIGRTVMTSHGVLLGEGSFINATAAGTNGQLLIGSTGLDPLFSSLTSTANTLTYVQGPGTLNIEVSAPLPTLPFPIASGGTGTTSFGITTSSVLYFDGTTSTLKPISAGSNGSFLNSEGIGLPPSFKPGGPGSLVNFTDNSNTSVTGSNFFILGSTAAGFPISTQFGTTTLFINMANLTVPYGGIGRTVLTAHGVVLGEGSNNLNVTAAGSNGQVLLGSSGADPLFAYLSSSSGTVSFGPGPGQLNLEAAAGQIFLPVASGGTARTVLTSYGVLLGEGSNPVNVTAAGTNGQVLVGATGLDPAFATITSLSNTVTFVISPNVLSIDLNGALPILKGGTNATSFSLNGVVYFNGTNLAGSNTSLANQFFVSQGNGVAPIFQSGGPGSLINFTDNLNHSATGSSFAIVGSTAIGFPITTQLSTTASSNYLFINLSPVPATYGGTGQSSLVSNGVLIGQGTNPAVAATAGTNGQLLIGASSLDPAFATVSSITNTITFIIGPSQLSIDLATQIQPNFGGTGRASLTSHGVLIGEGVSAINVTSAATNGQMLIGSTGADPAFASVSSISNTITFILGANQLSVDLAGAMPIANGGTNATSFGATNNLVYFDGTELNTMTSGTSGQLLVSAGNGIVPTFQTVSTTPGVTIFDNANNSVSSSGFVIVGSTAAGFPISTQFATSTLFINMQLLTGPYGGTGRSVLTSHGVLLGEGSFVNATNAGANGQLLIGSTNADPQFSTITSTGSTLTFVSGAGLLNIDIISPFPSLPLSIANGGAGGTSYGLTVSSVLYFDGTTSSFRNISAGTSGQFLISQGVGLPPIFQGAGPGSLINFTDNSNNSVTSSSFYILGDTAAGFPITTQLGSTASSGYLFINLSTVPSIYGGVGAPVLTSHGVLLGQGTSNLVATASATNGQVLIGSNTSDPVFALITSSGGTLTFVGGAGLLNIEVVSFGIALNVGLGGTGRTVLTNHGVLIGEGSNNVDVTLPAANGQVLIGATNADPAFATLVTNTGSLSFVFGSNQLSIDVVIPIPYSFGGTNNTSFGSTATSFIYSNGNKLVSGAAGTSGQFLVSQGNGLAPLFQSGGPGSLINLTDNFNNSVTASSFFILGSTSAGFPITTQVSSTASNSYLFINFPAMSVVYGGTGRTTLTSHGVLIGEGSNGWNATAAGTDGQLLLGAASLDPSFASVSSITNTITFVIGHNSLSVDIASPVQVPRGGTGRAILTSHGVLLGEGSNAVNVTSGGTNGQLLIGSTNNDPAFANVSSITNTITFIVSSNNLSIDLVSAVSVANGGLGRTVLTSHSVLIGEGGAQVNGAVASRSGQLLIGSSGADPAFANVSSITNTITFAVGTNSLSVDIASPVTIAYGGTNGTSYGTTASNIFYFDGTALNSISSGTAGQILASQGFGVIPAYQSSNIFTNPTTSFINLQGTVLATPPSAILQVGTNFAIIGPTATANLYSIRANSNVAASPGNTYTNLYGADVSPTASTSGSGAIVNYFGIRSAGNLSLVGSGTATVNAYGIQVDGSMASDTGTSINTAYGASIAPNISMTGTGTVGTEFGAYIKLTATAASGAATANAYGVFIDATTVQNTTNAYGLYVATPTGAGTNLSGYFTTAPQFGTPLSVASGGLGRTVLTSHAVLIGEGSNQVNFATGTNGQVLIGSNTTDPAFATISSISGTITFVLSSNGLSVDLVAPVSVAFGGTNATSFGTTISSVLYFDGNKISSITAGTIGQVLTSQGFGQAPIFVTAASVTASFINLQGTITATPPTAIMQVGTNFAIVGPTTTANLYDILANSTFTASPGNTYTNVYGIDVSPSALTSGSGAVVNFSGIRSAGTLSLTGTGTAT